MKKKVKRYKLTKRGKRIIANIFVFIFYTLLLTHINYKSINDYIMALILWIGAYISLLIAQHID